MSGVQSKSFGFTLIELLIVIGITVILAGAGTAAFLGFKNKNQVELAGDEIESLLRTTQVRAVSQENGEAWGVYFDNIDSAAPKIIVFKGSSYTSQNVVSAKSLNSTLELLDPGEGSAKEIAFNELQGTLISTSSLTAVIVALRSDNNVSTTITVFASGRVEKIRVASSSPPAPPPLPPPLGLVFSSKKIADGIGGLPANTLKIGDAFGKGIAPLGDLDGDGVIDIAVSANLDDEGGTNRGAVYILFMNIDGTVKDKKKITNGVGGLPLGTIPSNDRFGNYISAFSDLSGFGDLNGDGVADLVVGAPFGDAGGSNAGSVHILFLNSDGTVATSTKIANGVGGLATGTLKAGVEFGYSVYSIGDINGDTINDIVVGSWMDDTGPSNAGAVYVLFLTATGTVKEQHKIADGVGGLAAGTLLTGDNFGDGASLAGDINGDGVNDIAVGPIGDDTGPGSGLGALFALFMTATGTVKEQHKIADGVGGLAAGTLVDSAAFGTSVSWLGDFDQDGVPDVLVGADHDVTDALETGSAYILFLNNDGTVKRSQKIANGVGGLAPGTLFSGDEFGDSVSYIGDLNKDGVGDIAVGAPRDGIGDSGGAIFILFME